jgi:hypothetical protein
MARSKWADSASKALDLGGRAGWGAWVQLLKSRPGHVSLPWTGANDPLPWSGDESVPPCLYSNFSCRFRECLMARAELAVFTVENGIYPWADQKRAEKA